MNIKNYILTAVSGIKRTAVKKSPEIMLGVGIGMAFAAVVTAVTATPKALKCIEEEKSKLYPQAKSEGQLKHIELGVKDTVKAAWKCYIPAALLFSASAALLIGSHHIASKRTAAIAAAASVTETALRQYKDAIVENVAPEVKEKIDEAVSAKQMQKAPDPRDAYVSVLNPTGTWFCEPVTGHLFKSDRETIRAAANDIKQSMLNDGFSGSASLGDFLEKLGLNVRSDAASTLGWNISGNCLDNIEFSAQIAQNGEPCLVLRYEKPPVYKFDKAFVY